MYYNKFSIITISFVIILISISFSDSYSQSPDCIYDENDLDGDMIPNKWETQGIDINNDRNPDFGLAAYNVDPEHKDLFLEIDYMTHHDAFDGVIKNVIEAFKNSPVCNPDESPGINLHIEYDQEIPHQRLVEVYTLENTSGGPKYMETWKGFDELKKQYFGTSKDKKDNPNVNNTLLAKSKIFHYAIFAHAVNDHKNRESGISGKSHGIPSMDFVVTLGNWKSAAPNQVGDYNGNNIHQAATLMHEFGHNLGLGHGGINNGQYDGINCKPNYVSIMSYSRQMPMLLPPEHHKLDYSRGDLEPLDESNLNELKGITTKSQYQSERDILIFGPFGHQISFPNYRIDWDHDGTFERQVQADINKIDSAKCSDDSPGQILVSSNDWDNLIFITNQNKLGTVPSSGTSEESANATSGVLEEELTYNDVQEALAIHVDNVNNTSNTLAPESIPPENNVLPESIAVGDFYTENIFNNSLTFDDDMGMNFVNDVTEGAKDIGSKITEGGKDISGKIDDGLKDVEDYSPPALLDSSSFIEKVKSGNYDINYTQTINNLESIRDTFDSSFGGLAEDDVITEASDQKTLYSDVDNVIEILKANSCLEGNCITVEKDGNTTITY